MALKLYCSNFAPEFKPYSHQFKPVPGLFPSFGGLVLLFLCLYHIIFHNPFIRKVILGWEEGGGAVCLFYNSWGGSSYKLKTDVSLLFFFLSFFLSFLPFMPIPSFLSIFLGCFMSLFCFCNFPLLLPSFIFP